ncbi:hypothetical protein [Nocardia macrotermitis]|nr:hypothetical protein [Nocardia macrotermitis]
MTAMWFGLAAIALVGAIVLLYFDRLQRQRTGHVRQVWAKAQGYTYVSVEPALASTWRRGAMAKLGYLSAVDVVSGNRKGEKFVLFDLEDAATLVAVRRQIGSDIDIDLRLKTAAPPKDADLELLGAIGDRVVFATNPDIARHAVDQRMVAFIETLSGSVQQLWSEGNWTLGVLPVGLSSREWEGAVDAVLRLSGLLHVLPPVAGGESGELDAHDPGRPRARAEDDDPEYDENRSRARGYDDERRYAERPEPDRRYDDRDSGDPDDRAYSPAKSAEFDSERRGFDADRRGADADRRATDPDRRGFDADRRGADAERRGPDPDRRDFDSERRDFEIPADDSDEGFAPLVQDIAGESEPPQRRPALAVVPDPRSRVRRNWPPAEEKGPEDRGRETHDSGDFDEPEFAEDLHEDEQSERPGGPFHPGFRPYQGPAR